MPGGRARPPAVAEATWRPVGAQDAVQVDQSHRPRSSLFLQNTPRLVGPDRREGQIALRSHIRRSPQLPHALGLRVTTWFRSCTRRKAKLSLHSRRGSLLESMLLRCLLRLRQPANIEIRHHRNTGSTRPPASGSGPDAPRRLCGLPHNSPPTNSAPVGRNAVAPILARRQDNRARALAGHPIFAARRKSRPRRGGWRCFDHGAASA